jgi:hypothetical protein
LGLREEDRSYKTLGSLGGAQHPKLPDHEIARPREGGAEERRTVKIPGEENMPAIRHVLVTAAAL